MNAPLIYRIVPTHPQAHLFTVTCTLAQPAPEGQILRLPTWIPGSYLIREFARNVVRLAARVGATPVAVEKIAKDAWRCGPAPGPLAITYEVYAWDLSVRAAHLDQSHGFFTGSSVFLCPEGFEQSPCEVEIAPPEGEEYAAWRVATSMPRLDAPEFGFGRYRAENYDALIDHPVELGTFTLSRFEAQGVPHDVAITGRHNTDLPRLTGDLQRICAWQIAFFGTPAPMDHYLFQVMAVGEGYGGLEHRSSTSLICSRDDLPHPRMERMSEEYRGFLGLASHEYFHTWNVKRIKPAAFVPYDLSRESYTRLLWVFEGFTSYYDDLALLRCGLIVADSYLELLGRTVTNVLRGSGRTKQSVADSSFDAWIKYYRQDENAPNAVVSYYAKGALLGLLLDLHLRRESPVSLDHLMRALWQRHGLTGVGVPEDGVQHLAEEISGLDLGAFFDDFVYGTAELPLAQACAEFALRFNLRATEGAGDKGGRPGKNGLGKVALGAKLAPGNEARLAHVFDEGAAQRAGLAAGDQIIALAGLRASSANLDHLLQGARGADSVPVFAFRRDELLRFELPLLPAPFDTCWIELEDAAPPEAIARRDQWLGTAG
jgi:predicted metalloprotease with PDZ domain